MMNAGGIGISSTQAEALTSALLNTFPSSYIGETYKDAILNFLTAGAVMMLFDFGFANMPNYIKSLKEELKPIAPSAVHLVRADSIYFPLSYVLHGTIVKLEELYMHVTTVESMPNSENTLHLTEYSPANYTSYYNKYESVQDRWEKNAADAKSQVKLQLLFLGGFLDIIKALQKQLEDIGQIP